MVGAHNGRSHVIGQGGIEGDVDSDTSRVDPVSIPSARSSGRDTVVPNRAVENESGERRGRPSADGRGLITDGGSDRGTQSAIEGTTPRRRATVEGNGTDPPHSSETEESGTTSATETSTDGTDSVVDALLAELEADAIPDAKRIKLRNQLGLSAGSFDARLRRIQADISDLRAYTDAMETFLDENGGTARIIDESQERLDSLEATSDSLETRIEANESALHDGGEWRSETDEKIDELYENVERIDESISRLETKLEALEGDGPDDVGDRLEALQSDVESIKDWQEHLHVAFGAAVDGDGHV